MDHVAFQELAAGSALEDLDAGERERLDAHLTDCAACRSVSAELDDVLWDLALVAPEMAPPRSLHGAVFDAIHASEGTPTTGAALAAREPTPLRRVPPTPVAPARPRWATIAPLALAAVIGVVAIGLGAQVARLTQENAAAVAAADEAQGQVAARDGAMAVLIAPDHQTAKLTSDALAPDATAVAVFEPGTTQSYVMVANLPATPSGHVYQLWYADTAGVHALGTYHHAGTAAFVAPFGVDLASSVAAMITLEPDGGAVGEPGPQVVFGTL